jgi:hypothetical protein
MPKTNKNLTAPKQAFIAAKGALLDALKIFEKAPAPGAALIAVILTSIIEGIDVSQLSTYPTLRRRFLIHHDSTRGRKKM